MTSAIKKVFDTPVLLGQIWALHEDGTRYTGSEMACRWWERELFRTSDDAISHFSLSKVGDVFKTGVSAYERLV